MRNNKPNIEKKEMQYLVQRMKTEMQTREIHVEKAY